ncbi:MAG TPA: hypothetical protein PK265_00190 [Candidatus Saccharibacteria bacterium]|nr:hypothetical protein [Candidatus Saccharibacteria bacterium]HRQ97732.1 hypothetical protein [Candidatus Saccharibacteria bacterium]
MIFDEYYHFGLTQLYSHQFLPFITSQPPDSMMYGDVTRYGSYLAHYLMSFLLRIVELFTDDTTKQIIMLRLFNVGVFATAIVIFRTVLKRSGILSAINNITLLLFTLLPVTSLLAATINYDNFMILGFAIFIMMGQILIIEASKGRVSFHSVAIFISVGLLTSLVKSSFLPILFAGVLFLIFIFIKQRRQLNLMRTLKPTIGVKFFLTCLLLILSVGLFAERYGGNTLMYKTPVPDCQKVLSIETCLGSHPWERNYVRRMKVKDASREDLVGPVSYFISPWLVSMVSGNNISAADSAGGIPQNIGRPLPIVNDAIWILFAIVTIALIVRFRKIISGTYIKFVFICLIAYTGALFYMNYSQYTQLHTPVAISARYLLPFLPLLIAIGLSAAVQIVKSRIIHIVASLILIILMTQGGGFTSYIINSNPSWFWGKQKVIDANNIMKQAVDLVVKDSI